jgi:hypothetical protein
LSKRADAGFRVESLPRIGVRLVQEAGGSRPQATDRSPRRSRRRGQPSDMARLSLGGVTLAAVVTAGRALGPSIADGPVATRSARGLAEQRIDDHTRELYARGLQALEQPARASIEQAVAYLTETVERAPEFAPGWAALAEAQRQRMLYSPPPLQPPERAAARRSAERALTLDPSLGTSTARSPTWPPRFNQWGEVDWLFKRGLALSPDHPVLNHQHALFLMSVGRTAAAARLLSELHERSR